MKESLPQESKSLVAEPKTSAQIAQARLDLVLSGNKNQWTNQRMTELKLDILKVLQKYADAQMSDIKLDLRKGEAIDVVEVKVALSAKQPTKAVPAQEEQL